MKATKKIKCFECGSVVPWIEAAEDHEGTDICEECLILKYQYCERCEAIYSLNEDCPNGCDRAKE